MHVCMQLLRLINVVCPKLFDAFTKWNDLKLKYIIILRHNRKIEYSILYTLELLWKKIYKNILKHYKVTSSKIICIALIVKWY